MKFKNISWDNNVVGYLTAPEMKLLAVIDTLLDKLDNCYVVINIDGGNKLCLYRNHKLVMSNMSVAKCYYVILGMLTA